MSRDSRLAELFQEWRQLREKGTPATAEELCADAPELIDALNEQIRSAQTATAHRSTADFLDPNVLTAPMSEEESPPPRPDMAVSAASRFADLKFHDRGGLGEIYRARDEELGRSVALKFIKFKHLEDSERVDSFRTEAEITSRLDHPGVVPVY